MVIAAVYLPDIGRGFVKDDFGWIRDARARLSDPLHAPQRGPGFFRPLVTWGFVFDYQLSGLNPRRSGDAWLAAGLRARLHPDLESQRSLGRAGPAVGAGAARSVSTSARALRRRRVRG
jgi:hypothetical protein